MTTLTSENLTGVNQEGNHPNMPLKYLTATSIMADKVINKEGEKLGGIKDIMVDITTGKIEYIIIEFGGFLGIGEKFFAIPFRLLAVNTNEHAWILDQTKETLEAAPGFDKDHWPKTNSHEFDNSGAYWGSFMGPNTGGGY
ncbi:MAG: PRC-barrel domain-containing protein [Chryseolinea sp.]